MKKALMLLSAALLAVCLAACHQTAKPGQAGSGPGLSGPSGTAEGKAPALERTFSFNGCTFAYPDNASLRNSDYGKSLSIGSDCFILIEAPATVGELYSAADLKDAVKQSERYVLASLKNTIDGIWSKTRQEIDSQEPVEFNGIEMLEVTGMFTDGTTAVPYTAYYFLTEADGSLLPAYIVGVDVDDAESRVRQLVTELARQTKKAG